MNENTYPPYTNNSRCEKCGARGSWTNFHDGSKPCISLDTTGICFSNFSGPHMHKKCENCKYEWAETPINEAYKQFHTMPNTEEKPKVVWYGRNDIKLLVKPNSVGDYDSYIVLLRVNKSYEYACGYRLGYYYFSHTNPGWRVLPEDEKVLVNDSILAWTFLPTYCEPME